MPMHIREDGDAIILSNFGRLMNDPGHFDAPLEIGKLIENGRRKYVMELRAVGEMGDSGIGVLMTITRLVRKHGGDVVLASPSRFMRKRLDDLKMDDFWDVYESVGDAKAALDQLVR